jgi:hypothetical protein
VSIGEFIESDVCLCKFPSICSKSTRNGDVFSDTFFDPLDEGGTIYMDAISKDEDMFEFIWSQSFCESVADLLRFSRVSHLACCREDRCTLELDSSDSDRVIMDFITDNLSCCGGEDE